MTPRISMFSQGFTYRNKQFILTLPQRLPLGKNRKKVVSAVDDKGLSPSHRAPRAVFFPSHSFLTKQRGLCEGESNSSVDEIIIMW